MPTVAALVVSLALLAAPCPPVTHRVLVFNIEYGGGLVDFGKTVEVIERSGADVVLVEEAWGNMSRLAAELGYAEHSLRHQVLSRYPLLDPGPGDPRLLWVESSPGCVWGLANVHLPADPSIGDVLRGNGIEAALEVDRTSRLGALAPTLERLEDALADGLPVVLGGDFNARSHLDEAVAWPTSRAVADAGLVDAWRAVHPDAVARPGFTWWAARPAVDGWNPDPGTPLVRIDQLHVGGRIDVLAARLVGECGADGVDLPITPWPSDHRAVLFEMEIVPSPAPALVSAWPARVERGAPVRVRVRPLGEPGRLIVVPAEPSAAPVASMGSAGELTLDSSGLSPGTYEMRLIDGAGAQQAGTRIDVVAPGAGASLTVASPVDVGEPLEVTWFGAPGNRWDWVGVYPGDVEPTPARLLLWRHTGADVSGSLNLDEAAEGAAWPLAPGDYRIVLCEDDGYRVLAEATVTVSGTP